MVDLGGSLAVASMGRFATGVSTDINGSSSPLSSPFPSLPSLPFLPFPSPRSLRIHC